MENTFGLSNTLGELLFNGFEISQEHSYYQEFEKWGSLFVVSGGYRMAEYYVFMVYLVNKEGYIVWCFQPVRDYESLYAVRGIICEDINGDGLKDRVVLASYLFDEANNESVMLNNYSVYYQRSGGFYEDTDVKLGYQCSNAETMDEVKAKLRTYWGWN